MHNIIKSRFNNGRRVKDEKNNVDIKYMYVLCL